VKRRPEGLPWRWLLVSMSRYCCDLGAFAQKAKKSEDAGDRGDSNMIQARSECRFRPFETLFHSRVDVDAGARSIVEREALGTKKWYFECVLSRWTLTAAKFRITSEVQ